MPAQRCSHAMEDVVEAAFFCFIRAPCRRTVSTLIPSLAAMALLLMPRVTSSRISCCRGVSVLLDPVRLAFNEFVAADSVDYVQNMNAFPLCLKHNLYFAKLRV